MAIVSSVIASISPQRDGRRWVGERHTDQVGVQYARNYLADAADDLNAALAVYATQLGNDIANAEIQADLAAVLANGSLATATAVYATLAAIRAALRAAYQSATRTDAIMLGDFLSSLTDAQLQTLFSMTAAQVTTLRANKLTPAANAASTIRSATGA